MAPTDPLPADLSAVTLDESHVDNAVERSTEAHWNQTREDWRMMLRQGQGIGVVDPEDRLVATAIYLPYEVDFGWISMVLVTKAWRKNGLATYLLNRCIDSLEAMGRTPVLDATPDGRHVYIPLGFHPHFGLTRWQREGGPATAASDATRSITPHDRAVILAQDAQMLGGARPAVVDALMARIPSVCRIMDDGRGFVLARDGRNATQIGPLVAADTHSALALLADAVAQVAGPVFIDAADGQDAVALWLRENGFTEQRPFTRMARGRDHPFGAPATLYAAAGPELG